MPLHIINDYIVDNCYVTTLSFPLLKVCSVIKETLQHRGERHCKVKECSSLRISMDQGTHPLKFIVLFKYFLGNFCGSPRIVK